MDDFSSVIDVVYQAGKNLKKSFGNLEAINYKSTHYGYETASDVVTKLDLETEMYLARELKKIEPSIGFIGEEFGKQNEAERFWLADPIDGTGFFMRGIWGCTNMLALVENNEIVFSIIYDFILDKMYTAKKGKGAYLNKKRIKVSNRKLDEAFIYVECKFENEGNLPTYLKLNKSPCTVLLAYPAGIHFALTAEGMVEGRITFDPYGKDYDFAPGQLLVSEAGGIVKNIGANSFDYRNLNFLAVNKEVYKDLTEGPNAIFPIL